MDANLMLENSSQDQSRPTAVSEAILMDRIKELELQLKIFRQAETVGEIGHWHINLNTFETWYSENMFRLYGLEPYSLKAHPDSFILFVHKEDREIIINAFDKSYREFVPLHLEFRIITANGNERHVKVMSTITKNPKGETLLTGITQDITDRKILEIELRDSAEKLNLQNESFKHAEQVGVFGTFKINLHTRFFHFSDNFLRLFGLKPPASLIGFDQLFDYIHSNDQLLFRDIRDKIFEHQQAPQGEFRIVRPDGKVRQTRLECKLVRNPAGDQLVIGIIRDITRSDQLERQLKETNEKLLLQNEAFKQAEKLSNIGSWTWNLSTQQQHLSDNFYLLYGLKPQSILPGYDTLSKHFHPADRQKMKELYEKQINSSEGMDISFRIIRTDGEIRYMRSRSQPFSFPDGQTIIIGTTQDVTEDILLHQQLNERITFSEMMSDNILDKVVITNTSNNVIGWNLKAEKAYGLKRHEVIGKNVFELFPKIKNEVVIERYRRALAGEIVQLSEIELAYVKGFHEVSMVPIRDENGNVTAVMTLLHDISEQVNLRLELKHRLEFIEKLVESSAHRIVVLDRDLNYLYWNRKSEEFYQLSKEKVIGKNVAEVFPSYRQQANYAYLKKALLGETIHLPVNTESNLTIYTDEYMIPIMGNPKEVIAVLWIVHDLTEVVNAQQELKKQNKLLENVLEERKKTEEQVRKQAALLKQASEIANLGSWELDVVSNVFTWSDQLFRIYDYAPESFTPTLDFYLTTTEARDRELVRAAFESAKLGEHFSITHRIRSLDGRTLYIMAKGQPSINSEGVVTAVIGTAQDITEQKEIEKELIKKNDTIRLHYKVDRQLEILRKAGSWQLNLDSGEIIWGENMFHLFGCAPFSFKPELEKLLRFVYSEDHATLRKLFEEFSMLPDHHVESFEFRVKLKDGLHYFRSTCRKIINTGGSSVIGSTVDVTEDKLLHEQLAERINFVEALIESSIDKIIAFDKDLNILTWNKKCELTYEYTKEEVIGKSYLDIFPGIKENQEIMSALHSALEGIPVYLPAQKAYSGTGYVEKHYIPLVKGEKEVYGVLNIIHDVTDRLQAERELRDLNDSLFQKNKELEDMNEELTSFAFIASHDLREPLRKIQVFSDRLLQRESETLSNSGKEEFQRIMAAVKRMDELIDDILSFSNIHAGQKTIVPVDLNKILRLVEADMSELLREKDVVIECSELPTVDGNPSHFLHLFLNLLSNAIKFQLKNQRPIIKIESRVISGNDIQHPHAVADATYLQLTFADNGIGFEQQYEHRIFQMFQRLHGMHEFPGTGMGLTICKKVVEAYKGFITAASNPGEGAKFDCYFKLP